MTKESKIGEYFIGALLFLVTLVMVVPILHLLAISFSEPEKVGEVMGLSIIPEGFSLINYMVILTSENIVTSIRNTVCITAAGTALNLLLTSLGAYVLTRRGLAGKKFFMLVLIIVMVVEPGMIQEYFVIKNLNLMDSLWALILYKGVDVYYLIILMRFFDELPDAFVEAASIDGAGHLRILFNIMLPLNKAAIATIGMFYAVFHWNEFFRATIYLNTPDKFPLQVVMRQFVILNDTASLVGLNNLFSYNDFARLNYQALQAATIVIAIVPILALYPFILKYYSKGVMTGGIKG